MGNQMNMGQDSHYMHSIRTILHKFWVSLILTIPVIVYSPAVYNLFGFNPPVFVGSLYIPFIFSTIIFFYGGLLFIKGATSEIKSKAPGMMTLISLAIITAFIYSITTEFYIQGDSFFWELATLITIMLLGHWIEMKSINNAQNALSDIQKLLPDSAEKIIDNKIIT